MKEEETSGVGHITNRPHQAASRSAFVLERCCLQKRRVNPIRSAFPVLRLRSGLKVLKRRFVLVLVTQPARRRGAIAACLPCPEGNSVVRDGRL
jgi:hypothetical protein